MNPCHTVKRTTLVEETSVRAALFATLFGVVLVAFCAGSVRDARGGWDELTVTASDLCSCGCRSPVSLKVVGRRKDTDNGSSSSELMASPARSSTSSRSGMSSSSDYVINSAIRSGPAVPHTSLGTASLASSLAASRAALSSAFRVSLYNFFSFSDVHG